MLVKYIVRTALVTVSLHSNRTVTEASSLNEGVPQTSTENTLDVEDNLRADNSHMLSHRTEMYTPPSIQIFFYVILDIDAPEQTKKIRPQQNMKNTE